MQNRVIKSAPEVALSAAFINEIYEVGINGFSLGGSVGGDAKVQIGRDISASVSGRLF